jgi:hypothetical protein
MTETAKLTASDGADYDYFGFFSIAISGDTVVVGAVGDDIGANTDQGSAYVFVKPPGGWGNMTQTAKLTASDGAAGDWFGNSVAISGDTVVVAAAAADIGANTDQGSAYVFVKPPGGWGNMTETAKLTASDGADSDQFGASVAISGDTVVVGAVGDDIGANTDQGSAYVFVKPAGGWTNMTETAKLTASDGAYGDRFGFSVAISGDTVVVGAPWKESAYVFVEPHGNCPATPLAYCDAPKRALVLMKDHNNDTKDVFTLKLIRNTPLREGSEFGDPTITATYITCVWDGSTLIAQLKAPPGSNWQALSTKRSKGYKYVDDVLVHDGLKLMKVVGGPTGTPKETGVVVKGKGVNLPDPTIPVSSPVNITAQVIDLATGTCFGQSFSDSHVKKNGANSSNTVRTFKAVLAPP